MEKVLIICLSNLERDPRPNKQISYLKKYYNVLCAGYGDPEIPGVSFLKIQKSKKSSKWQFLKKAIYLKFSLYEKFYWKKEIKSFVASQMENDYKVIIANDIEAMPIAKAISNKKCKIIFDAHEYYPNHFQDRWIWRFFYRDYFQYLCKRYIKKADAMITVSEGISKEYQRHYGIEAQVILNAAPFHGLSPSRVQSTIKIIHHGAATPSRKIESMVNMMQYLPNNYQLDLMLVPNNKKYFYFLKKKIKSYQNIKMIKPVDMKDIVLFSNQYDIGLFLVYPSTFNLKHTLPNKFFEYIQSRLAIAIGPSIEMAQLVKRFNNGIVSKSFNPEDLAQEILKLSPEDIQVMKNFSDEAAATLSYENEVLKLKLIIESLFSGILFDSHKT